MIPSAKTNIRRLLKAVMATATCALFHPFSISSQTHHVCDFGRACEICDSSALSPVEGVWSFPDDNVMVLIAKSESFRHTPLAEYELTVVETYDASLSPGEMVGTLHATADRNIFNLKLFTNKRRGVFTSPSECLLKLSESGEVLLFTKQKKKKSPLRITINPNSLLPRFWKLFRISLSPSSQSSEQPPSGLIKIYPSYDGNGSSRRSPIYL